jgi:hypothetical protein
LIEQLAALDCEPVVKERYRHALALLLKDVGRAKLDDRLAESKIRDWQAEIDALSKRISTKKDSSRYSGTIRLCEDPLIYQNRIRGEWP